MKCYVFRDLLPEFSEGLCSNETAADMEEHQKNCEECRRYAERVSSEKIAAKAEKEAQPEQLADDCQKQIQPFQKVKKTYKKKTRKLKFGIAVLAVCCIGLCVLTVGQIWPQTQLPSFERMLIRHRAKQVGVNFAEGNMDRILDDMLDMAEFRYSVNLYNREKGAGLYDQAEENLRALHAQYLSGKVEKVSVDYINYEKLDVNHAIYQGTQEKGEGVPFYQCDVTIKTEQANFHIGLYYLTDRYYYLAWVTAITDDSAIGEAGEQFERWINYFRNSVIENSPDSYFIEYVLTGEERHQQASTYRFVLENRFVRDCMEPQATDEGESSPYSAALSKRMYEITEQVETIEFTIKNKGYDTNAKKGKAILFWSFRDEKRQYVNMMKNLYYGPYGFQAADDQEIICCDGVLDPELRQQLEKVFDSENISVLH
ncbi:MAG: hypothetical protein IJ716_07185 [Lachnospiraceae bacterium]|nr:hypothetical protein [Lachnospiraceae bacterium]